MSILRRDPLTNGWVIFAEDRFNRPPAAVAPVADPHSSSCPFCPGHEHLTPSEVLAIRPPGSRKDTIGWSVRAIPNQFAVLHIEGKFDRRGEGPYDMMNGIGAHEVIVETPEHEASFSDYSRSKLQEIVGVLRERHRDLLNDQRFRYIQIFRNQGEAAGATIRHPHSQIIALPILPRIVLDELTQSFEYWSIKERCIFCDMIMQDCRSQRTVYENDSFVAVAPFAAKFPFETWIYPKEHSSSFHTISDELLGSLADVFYMALRAFIRAIPHPPYNIVFHSAPTTPEKQYHNLRARVQDHYHWHIEIIPRATSVAGFEYGTGIFVNPVLPEHAAEYMRNVIEETLSIEPARNT